MAKKVPILIHFSKKDIDELDRVIKIGHYASRSEAMRDALKRRLNELKGGEHGGQREADRRRPDKRDVEKYLEEYINEDPYKRLKQMGLGL